MGRGRKQERERCGNLKKRQELGEKREELVTKAGENYEEMDGAVGNPVTTIRRVDWLPSI